VEVNVSRRTLGILATVAGSAIGAWWWSSRRASSTAVRRLPARDRGTVIYDNHATVLDSAEYVV
jgi:hypothetical protein